MLTIEVGPLGSDRRRAAVRLLADAVGSPDAAGRHLDASTILVGLRSGEVVAAGCVAMKGPAGRLTAIAVADGLRGHGYGRSLVDGAFDQLELSALGAETDGESVGFYRSCGFSVVSLGERYPGVERFHVTRTAALRVRALALGDEAPARAAHERLAADGVEFCLGLDEAASWAAWLDEGEWRRAGDCVPPWVPETFVGGFVGPKLVGRLSVRHELNEQLALVGGHVGYAVLPEHRRRGYAGDLMREGLRIAQDVGLDRVLVTCSDDNVASVRTIERAGGMLQDVVAHPVTGEPKRRYWITLTP